MEHRLTHRRKKSFPAQHTAYCRCRLSFGGRIYYVKTPYWLHLVMERM